MSELNFPKNPAVGQEYTFNSLLYMFDGVKWVTKGTGYNPVQDLYEMLASDVGASFVGVNGYDNVQAALEAVDTNLQTQIDTKINADFVSRFDRESLRRSYAEAGFNLVTGSFELGGTVTTATDVLLYEADGHVYKWDGVFPIGGKVVPQGSTPASTGGVGAGAWVDRSDVTLRSELAEPGGAGLIGGLPVFVTATEYAGGATTSSTNNDAAIIAAINDAIATGSFVYWPAVYEVQGDIPNFHAVHHDGPGGIKRGADIFRAHAFEWTQSNLYCSPSATSDGDGLTAASPMRIGNLRQVLLNYTPLIGSWDVKLAAGTYPISSTVNVSDILTTSDFLKIMGPDVAYGVPTAIFEGAGSSAIFGFQCGGRQKVWLKDVKLQNFTQPNAYGVSGLDFCELWADNVHVNNCTFIGLSVAHGRMRVTGGIYEGCEYNLRAYNMTEFTISYNGVGTICRNPTGFGSSIQIRDGSSGVLLAGTQATGGTNTYGIELINWCRARFTGITVTGNKIGVRTQFSTFFDDGTNNISGNSTSNFQLESSTDTNNAADQLFDPVTKNRSWGGASTGTFRWHFRKVPTGSGSSSSYTYVIEDSSPVLGLMSAGTGISGMIVGKPGVGSQASILYNHPDDTWRWRINNTDSYRMSTTFFAPMADNAMSLGLGANRYSVVYAGTGTINTSDARDKTDPLPIDDNVLDAWGGVQLITFQWLDSIRQKGADAARWHFGVIAQQVRDAFLLHGLDGCDYGLLCYDEWEDEFEPVVEVYQKDVAVVNPDGTHGTETQTISRETGEMRLSRHAGNRWGIRADQCLFIEAAYQRRRCDRIEARLNAAGL